MKSVLRVQWCAPHDALHNADSESISHTPVSQFRNETMKGYRRMYKGIITEQDCHITSYKFYDLLPVQESKSK